VIGLAEWPIDSLQGRLMMGSDLSLAAFNLIVCSVGGWISICRMAKMSHSETKLAIRLQYMIWFCLFFLSGWSFLVGESATVVQFLMSCGVFGYLAIGFDVWRWRAPDYTRRA